MGNEVVVTAGESDALVSTVKIQTDGINIYGRMVEDASCTSEKVASVVSSIYETLGIEMATGQIISGAVGCVDIVVKGMGI